MLLSPLSGATRPNESAPGTIRGDLAIEVGRNVIHGSDTVENANNEIALWFPEVREWECEQQQGCMSKRCRLGFRGLINAKMRNQWDRREGVAVPAGLAILKSQWARPCKWLG